MKFAFSVQYIPRMWQETWQDNVVSGRRTKPQCPSNFRHFYICLAYYSTNVSSVNARYSCWYISPVTVKHIVLLCTVWCIMSLSLTFGKTCCCVDFTLSPLWHLICQLLNKCDLLHLSYRKRHHRCHTVNWQAWQSLVKVDLVLSIEQHMQYFVQLSTKNLTIGNHLINQISLLHRWNFISQVCIKADTYTAVVSVQ